MLDHMELVEKLSEKAGISLEEAKAVLERNNWDILDAMIELERAGKVEGAKASTEDSKKVEYETVKPTVTGTHYEQKEEKESEIKSAWKRFKNTMKFIWGKMIDNRFVIKRNDDILVKVPIVVLIILLLLGLWRTVLILLLGMLFKFRYSFEGEDLGTEKVNRTMERASEFADNIMKEKGTSDQTVNTYTYTEDGYDQVNK